LSGLVCGAVGWDCPQDAGANNANEITAANAGQVRRAAKKRGVVNMTGS